MEENLNGQNQPQNDNSGNGLQGCIQGIMLIVAIIGIILGIMALSV